MNAIHVRRTNLIVVHVPMEYARNARVVTFEHITRIMVIIVARLRNSRTAKVSTRALVHHAAGVICLIMIMGLRMIRNRTADYVLRSFRTAKPAVKVLSGAAPALPGILTPMVDANHAMTCFPAAKNAVKILRHALHARLGRIKTLRAGVMHVKTALRLNIIRTNLLAIHAPKVVRIAANVLMAYARNARAVIF